MQMQATIDPNLVSNIVHEVKSKGLFDKFRKDSMSDVDTKPAYQNLRLRVENTVHKFLTEQSWTPETNKNQLREKLRKHITEAGFLDIGVERIVDQVVNPKIATVFQPQMEDIAYQFLGIKKPERKPLPPQTMFNGHLEIKTDLLPTDLEQVSPDSDKLTSKSDSFMDIDEKADDFESPAFEPLVDVITASDRELSQVSEDDLVPPGEEPPPAPPGTEDFVIEGNESNNSIISGISNLTSQNSISKTFEDDTDKVVQNKQTTNAEDVNIETISAEISQESQLSQVSSNSRLSIVTNDTEEDHSITRIVKEESNVNISEEAQMPKFNENSNSNTELKSTEPLHFDIKKDEIIFEGTERRGDNHLENISPNDNDEPILNENNEKPIDPKPIKEEQEITEEIKPKEEDEEIPRPALFSDNFNFSKININPPDYLNSTDSKTLEDSIGKELRIIEQSDSETILNTEVSMAADNLTQSEFGEDPKVPSVESSTKSEEDLKMLSPISSSKSNIDDKIKTPNSVVRSRDRDHGHSSSSRHKKHTKDKRSDRDRNRERSSSSKSDSRKQSSSSDHKHSSSHRQSSSSTSSKDGKDNKSHRSSSSSHRSKHSSRDDKSKTDDRKSRRSDDHNKKNDKEKDRNENQSRSSNDDHYSSKQKIQRKKSTDSNDGDSSQNCSKNDGTPWSGSCNAGKEDKTTESSPNTTQNDSSGVIESLQIKAEELPVFSKPTTMEIVHMSTKPVILDALLIDPNTKFIEMCGQSVQINSKIISSPLPKQQIEISEEELAEFNDEDETFNKIQNKIKLLNEKIKIVRQKQYGLIFKDEENSDVVSSSTSKTSYSPRVGTSHSRKRKSGESTVTNATLTIDCVQYNNINKKFSFVAASGTKVSPTISETSLGSKENECTEKNVRNNPNDGLNKTKQLEKKTDKRNSISNQRYTSDDLYKPRTVLSQRSKRRGLDAEDI